MKLRRKWWKVVESLETFSQSIQARKKWSVTIDREMIYNHSELILKLGSSKVKHWRNGGTLEGKRFEIKTYKSRKTVHLGKTRYNQVLMRYIWVELMDSSAGDEKLMSRTQSNWSVFFSLFVFFFQTKASTMTKDLHRVTTENLLLLPNQQKKRWRKRNRSIFRCSPIFFLSKVRQQNKKEPTERRTRAKAPKRRG